MMAGVSRYDWGPGPDDPPPMPPGTWHDFGKYLFAIPALVLVLAGGLYFAQWLLNALI